MSDFYDSLLASYDEVEESHGLGNEPLPAGWYILRVAKLLDKSESANKVTNVRMQLEVVEGQYAKRMLFISQALNASPVDSDGNTRDEAAFKKANDNIIAQVKGLMKSLKVHRSAPIGEGMNKLLSHYSVDQWEGREFVARVTVRPPREYQGKTYDASNRLAEFFPLDDPKRGAAYVRTKGTTAATTSNTPQTI